jgi:chemotaxis protein MotA
METIAMMSKLSEKARRDGILSLESDVASIPDAFVAAGLKMAVDGIDPDTIESTMRMEIMAMQDRHKSGKKFFDIIKTYGPGLGLIATLIGQIGMFKNLGGDIATMGYMLAVAVVATMYGTVLANCIAGPMGDKLAYRSGEEILAREMALQAILSIQAGENPRVTLDKMSAFIPASTREKAKAA